VLPADVTLCPALAGDGPAIGRAVCAAFGHDLEARLVERLERDGRVRVSLVARAAGDVVGHAMLSRADLVARGDSWPALALAPVAVVPERQRRGIGSALVRACIALAGPRLPIFVIGAPAFYGRFGFEPAEPYGVTSRFEVPLGHFMVRPGGAAPAPLPRLLDYPPAFG
jgi:putative acetyltransferase